MAGPLKSIQDYLHDLRDLALGRTVLDDGGASVVGGVVDVTQFYLESSTLLGSSATFTGPMRDCTTYNWAGAKAGASVAGTLDLDESSAASGANIYQVATAATAASPAAHGTPASFSGQEARVAPSKTVLRFIRIVYVNGASAQTGTFDLGSALGELN